MAYHIKFKSPFGPLHCLVLLAAPPLHYTVYSKIRLQYWYWHPSSWPETDSTIALLIISMSSRPMGLIQAREVWNNNHPDSSIDKLNPIIISDFTCCLIQLNLAAVNQSTFSNDLLWVYEIDFNGVTLTVTDWIPLIAAAYVMDWNMRDFPVPVGRVTIVSIPDIRLLIADLCSSVITNPQFCISANTSGMQKNPFFLC